MTVTLWEEAESTLHRLRMPVVDLAAFLVSEGVSGVRGLSYCCPVARYLRKELTIPYIDVDASDVEIYDDQGNRYRINTPLEVSVFLTTFDLDNTSWPELVDPEGPTHEEFWGRNHYTAYL